MIYEEAGPLSLPYALTYFCDAMLYVAALGFFGLLGNRSAGFFYIPLVLSAGCWLCERLMNRGKWRWLGLTAIVPCFFLAGSVGGIVAALPMIVYLPLYVYNNQRVPDYYYAAERFRYSLIVVGVILVFSLAVNARSWKLGLPFMFLYITLSITLLRLLRHDGKVAQSRRFRILNLAEVALVCAIGFAASQPEILALLRSAWLWFAEHILLNLASLIAYALQWALFGAAWLFTRLFGFISMDMEKMPDVSQYAPAQPELGQAANSIQALPLLIRLAIKGLGIAVLTLLAFMLLRALSRQIARIEQVGGSEQRESLDDHKVPGDSRFRPWARVDGVRRQYRQALMILRARGGSVSPTMNTLQIQRENRDITAPEALEALRDIYLPVRYGNRAASPEDQRRAKRMVERIRKA